MRRLLTLSVMSAALVAASAALAAPTADLRGVAARIQVLPEARSDVTVTLSRANGKLPLRIRRFGDRVYITGDVGRLVHGCRTAQGARSVLIWGRAAVAYEDLPLLVIHSPLAVHLVAGDAVFGEVQRSGSVDFTNRGCGDLVIADVQGRLRLNQAGAGDIRVGAAGSADLSVEGSGGISTGPIRAELAAVSSGSGDISVQSVSGPVDARVAGPGNITIASGAATAMTVSIAGSGAVTMHGSARSLQASIAGKGDITVDRVMGPVTKQVFGSGVVRVGH